MHANGIVTLTTDFGLSDPYAGIMRGAVLSANPDARVVDITHGIRAHDIMCASFTIAHSCDMFPDGTVHCAVVDPGVGGERKNIAVRTGRYCFVGPDNGIFGIVLAGDSAAEIREITNPAFMRAVVSNTFHGRDVFAPCAGMLSRGASFEDVGPALAGVKMLVVPEPVISGDHMTGEVLSVDSFGNMVTTITEAAFRKFVGTRPYAIYFASERFTSLAKNYEEIPAGTPRAIIGSGGYLEISMSSGSAAEYFMTAAGSTVTIRRD